MEEGLDEAITYYCKVLPLRPPDHPGRSIFLISISIVLGARYGSRAGLRRQICMAIKSSISDLSAGPKYIYAIRIPDRPVSPAARPEKKMNRVFGII